MHGWETRMLLKHYLERDVSKAAVSRRFGVSRRTIHAWVETGQLDRDLSSGGSRYAPRPPAPHKLAPYTRIIDARLEELPGLSAQRLFDEVRAAGYPGGYSRVRDYVRAVRPREPTESVVRFETPAGRQGQVDVATFTLPWGRRHALVVVLSYSRQLWLCFYRRQTMAVWTAGLERAFARFGGVPKELLFDQMRAVVLSDQRVGGGELVLNAEFLRVAAHWGSTRAHAGRIGRRPRARWSGQSATSVTASSTGVRSRTTRSSTSRRRAGWRARPTCVGTVRRASAQWTASSGTSVRCCVPWHAVPTSVSASTAVPSRPTGACPTPSRWSAGRCGSTRRRRDDGDRE